MIRTFVRGLRMLSAVAALAAVALAVFVPLATAEEIRTETSFSGYRSTALSAPVSVQLFERLVPIPVDPGEPHLDVSVNFADTKLTTGPLAFATASAIWPGFGIADGLGQLACDESVLWPFMARAQYPADPNTASAEPGMTASALGLDVVAESAEGGDVIPGLVNVKGARGFTTSIVKDGNVISHAESVPGLVTVMDGLITIDGFRTVLDAVSDGETGKVVGGQEAGRVTVAGTTYQVDDSGVHVIGENPLAEIPVIGDLLAGGLPFGLGGDLNLQELLGVRIEAIPGETDTEGARAVRTVQGVRITFDTGPLKDLLDLAVDPVQGVLADVAGSLPEDPPNEGCGGSPVRGPRSGLEFLTSTLDFRSVIAIVVGRAAVNVNGTDPLLFDPPDIPMPPPAAPVAPPAGVPLVPPPSGDAGTVEPPALTEPEQPTIAQPDAPAGSELAVFEGLPVGLVVAGLALISLAAYGLSQLTSAAFPAASGLGGAARLPDQRG